MEKRSDYCFWLQGAGNECTLLSMPFSFSCCMVMGIKPRILGIWIPWATLESSVATCDLSPGPQMLLEASYTVAVSHIFLAPLCLPDPVVLGLDCLLLGPAVPSLLVYGSVGPFRDPNQTFSVLAGFWPYLHWLRTCTISWVQGRNRVNRHPAVALVNDVAIGMTVGAGCLSFSSNSPSRPPGLFLPVMWSGLLQVGEPLTSNLVLPLIYFSLGLCIPFPGCLCRRLPFLPLSGDSSFLSRFYFLFMYILELVCKYLYYLPVGFGFWQTYRSIWRNLISCPCWIFQPMKLVVLFDYIFLLSNYEDVLGFLFYQYFIV